MGQFNLIITLPFFISIALLEVQFNIDSSSARSSMGLYILHIGQFCFSRRILPAILLEVDLDSLNQGHGALELVISSQQKLVHGDLP